jgi:hypothetical protein
MRTVASESSIFVRQDVAVESLSLARRHEHEREAGDEDVQKLREDLEREEAREGHLHGEDVPDALAEAHAARGVVGALVETATDRHAHCCSLLWTWKSYRSRRWSSRGPNSARARGNGGR